MDQRKDERGDAEQYRYRQRDAASYEPQHRVILF
jgi:hypothetical protein